MYNVLCALPLEGEYKAMLEKAGPGCRFIYELPRNISRSQLEEADVIIGCVSPKILKDLPRLKFVQLDSAGSDAYAGLPLFSGENAPALCNATGAYGDTIAEYMVGSIIMLIRHFHIYRDQMAKALWERRQLPTCIKEKSALVIGLGDIGSNFAYRMKAMGCRVKALRRTAGDAPDCVDAVYTPEHLRELLPEADFVALCVPNTPHTQKIINKETLALMKKGAILVNVGRGSAVDSDALAEALNTGRLGGAALDVTDPEPLPPEHPLWKCENCFITPHVAGLFRQELPLRLIAERSARNLANFLAGKPLESPVDLSTGYRVSRS